MIYLEPRSRYDKAIIDEKNIVYSLEKLIDILMENLNCNFIESIDFYCFNIEPLIYKGLKIHDDLE